VYLFDLHIGIATSDDATNLSMFTHCCEACRSMDGCVHWKLGRRHAPLGVSAASCALYGRREQATAVTAGKHPAVSESSSTSVVLMRTDAEKLRTLTRCHHAYIRWLKAQCAGIAELELLVDASALPSEYARSVAQAQLRSLMNVSAYLYTVERIHRAFPAVKHWPSPESHATPRNRIKGDVVKVWWAKVVKRHRSALGPRVASRLTSYLIHEPSLVLWMRKRKAVAIAKREAASTPSYIWVVEDDAVFVGDLPRFLRAFHPTQALPSALPRHSAVARSSWTDFSPSSQSADLISTFANLDGAVEAASHDWKTVHAWGVASSRPWAASHVAAASVAFTMRWPSSQAPATE